MNNASRDAIWARLRAAGVASGEVPADGPAPVPWYVRAMVGAAAWIAAVFIISAILGALSGLFRSSGAMTGVGLVLCVVAVVVLHVGARSMFAEQFGFALSLAGQGMFAAGMLSGTLYGPGHAGPRFEATQFLVIAAFEAALLAAAPAYVHRVTCALGAALAVGAALVVWRAGAVYAPAVAIAFTLAALAGIRDGRRLALWQPMSVGLALALLASIALLIVEPSFDEFGRGWKGPPRFVQAGQGAMLAVFAAVVVVLMRAAAVPIASRAGLAVAVLGCAVAAASWPVSGLLAAGVLLLVAFAVAHEVLLGLGVIALLASLSRYYYGLEAPLLVKSGALLAAGIVLLAAWFALRFFGPPAERDDRA